MVSKAEAEEYVLLTNTGLSLSAAELGCLLETGLTRDRLSELRRLLRGAPQERVAALSDQELMRLRRCRVSVDRRSRAELRDVMVGHTVGPAEGRAGDRDAVQRTAARLPPLGNAPARRLTARCGVADV
jgi:hypothetical protein